MNNKRKLIEEAIIHMDNEFKLSELCFYISQISHHGLTHQEVGHILPQIPGISLKGKVLQKYLYRNGYVNLYVKE